MRAFAEPEAVAEAERDGRPLLFSFCLCLERFADRFADRRAFGFQIAFGVAILADVLSNAGTIGRRLRLTQVGAPIIFRRVAGRVQGPDAMPFIAASGLSWWEALYEDGRTVGEWDSALDDRKILTPSRERAGTSRWEEIDRVGLRQLRLIGPSGQVGNVQAARDYALFQFKIGVATLGAGPDLRRLSGQHRVAHVIGAIIDPPTGKEAQKGVCVCFAWEHVDEEGNPINDGFGRMVGPFTDHVGVNRVKVMVDGQEVERPDGFNFHKVGPLGLENLSLKV